MFATPETNETRPDSFRNLTENKQPSLFGGLVKKFELKKEETTDDKSQFKTNNPLLKSLQQKIAEMKDLKSLKDKL